MAYTEEQLSALEAALAKGEKRVTFGDKTVEYRSVEELRQAILDVERGLYERAASPVCGPAHLGKSGSLRRRARDALVQNLSQHGQKSRRLAHL